MSAALLFVTFFFINGLPNTEEEGTLFLRIPRRPHNHSGCSVDNIHVCSLRVEHMPITGELVR